MVKDDGEGTVTLDFSKLYQFSQDEVFTDIKDVTYSNHAFVQVMKRDVFIDFLTVPGIRTNDGRVAIEGKRIYLTHAHAKKLAESLLTVLEDTNQKRGFEQYDDGKAQGSE